MVAGAGQWTVHSGVGGDTISTAGIIPTKWVLAGLPPYTNLMLSVTNTKLSDNRHHVLIHSFHCTQILKLQPLSSNCFVS